MREEKDLERLFQERFKDFEAQPKHDLWEGILNRLESQGEERKPALFQRRLGVAAAMFALAFLGTIGYLSWEFTIPGEKAPITDVPKVNKGTIEEEPGNSITNINNKTGIQNPGTPLTSSPKTPVSKNNTEKPDNIQVSASKENPGNTPTRVKPLFTGIMPAILIPSNTSLTTTVLTRQTDNLFSSESSSLTAALEEEKEDPEKQSTPLNRWVFNPSVAPVYYNTMSKGSPIENSFDDNYKSGETHLSYGLNVAYQLAENLSIRTGMNRVTMGYSTNGVSFSPSSSSITTTGNIDYSGNNLNIVINDLGQRPQNAFQADVPKAGIIYNGNMIQRMGYLEVPLEVKYKMAGNRLGFHLIGGMSSLFLLDNEILLQSSTIFTEVGKANNINSMNFSTNLGLGVDYWLSKELLFNLEPMFKYQWNTFSGDDGGFSPYLLGIYTGFSFRF